MREAASTSSFGQNWFVVKVTRYSRDARRFARSSSDKRNRPKQGVGEAEQAQATDNDYATVARGWDEYASLAEAAIFEYAFKLGMKIAIETLK